MGEDELTLQTAIEDFITDRELNNHSEKTIKTYKQRLRYFTTWLVSAHNVVLVKDLQLVHLGGWISYLQKTPTYRGKKLSDDSIHSYGQSLLAFCHWLEREELIEKPITIVTQDVKTQKSRWLRCNLLSYLAKYTSAGVR